MNAETEKTILEKTTCSPERIEEFRTIRNAYWQSLRTEDFASKSDALPISDRGLKISNCGMATFFAGTAMKYNPNAVPGLKGVIQFRFETEVYRLIISGEVCQAHKGEFPAPSHTIISPEKLWLDISRGTLNGTKAYMEGLYKVEGDMNLLMKLNQLFGTGIADGEQPAKETMRESPTDDKIPEHRGPVHLPGMTWLTVAFLPWMILWIWGSITPGPIPRAVAAGVAVSIAS
jgi:putative sterol carrier protein